MLKFEPCIFHHKQDEVTYFVLTLKPRGLRCYEFGISKYVINKHSADSTKLTFENSVTKDIFIRETSLNSNPKSTQIFIKYMHDIVLEISFLDINSQNRITGSCLKF